MTFPPSFSSRHPAHNRTREEDGHQKSVGLTVLAPAFLAPAFLAASFLAASVLALAAGPLVAGTETAATAAPDVQTDVRDGVNHLDVTEKAPVKPQITALNPDAADKRPALRATFISADPNVDPEPFDPTAFEGDIVAKGKPDPNPGGPGFLSLVEANAVIGEPENKTIHSASEKKAILEQQAALRAAKLAALNENAKGQNADSQKDQGHDPFGSAHINAAGDAKVALEEALTNANQGDVPAQLQVAHIYARGIQVNQDLTQAARWFTTAAQAGDAAAQTELAFMLYNGRGVELDRVQAMSWFQQAATGNNPEAQFALGQIHAHGQGVPVDKDRARTFYEAALANGHEGAAKAMKALETR